MVEILPIKDCPGSWKAIVSIFFESSPKKIFKDELEKDTFLYKYLGFYKEKYSDLFLVAKDGDKILGYICGCSDSLEEKALYELVSHYSLFEDLYSSFPAHLHINLCGESRGLGVGSKLIKAFEQLCSTGVHLITGPEARNRTFYLKNRYTYESLREFNGLELLFMGKSL